MEVSYIKRENPLRNIRSLEEWMSLPSSESADGRLAGGPGFSRPEDRSAFKDVEPVREIVAAK